MTRELRIAFCGEGTTDSRVIPVLIEKMMAELTPVDTFNLSVDTQKWDTRRSFTDACINLVNQAQLLYSVIVVHVDADGPDTQQVTAHKVTPAMEALTTVRLPTETVVWAIPVQAIEAWLLVSAETFAEALTGASARARELNLPRRPDTIHRDEAKRLFAESVYQLLATTQRQRRRLRPAMFLERVATDIALNDLRRLPAFQQFETEFRRVVTRLGFVAE